MTPQLAALPALREEVHCLPGPSSTDGAPTWTLHDPANNRFFRIGWREFQILTHWQLKQPKQIAESICRETVLQVEEQEVEAFARFLMQHNLLQTQGGSNIQLLKQQAALQRETPWQWLLHHYLFLRIPLLKPDPLLAWLYRYVAWVYSARFLYAVLICFVVSMFLLSRQWDNFLATFADFFNWGGLVQFGLALILAKTLHEFGHALTLHRFGCRVPTMGVAFIVMYPLLYTDASEAWKLPDRKQRLAVAFAGVAAELILAVFAALLWNFLLDGPMRSAAFLLASSTWVMTVLINLSPFMRFDGYYLLADWLGVDNLQPRAFAYARWVLRRLLFGVDLSVPEHLSKGMQVFFTAYAWATWLYRFLLFLGIALLVYHFCFKLLGIFLMAVEVGWFILRPVLNEMKAWTELLPSVSSQSGRWRLLILIVLIVCLGFPWQGHVTLPALIKAERYAEMFLPRAAKLELWQARNKQTVIKDDLIAQFSSPELTYQSRHSSMEGHSLAWQLAYQGMNQSLMQRRRVLLMELASASAKQIGVKQLQDELQIRAPFDGRLLDVNEQAQVGQWMQEGEALFIVADLSHWIIEAYVSEADLRYAEQAVSGMFYPDNPDLAPIPCRVQRIDRGAAARIPYLLASDYGGDIAARQGQDRAPIPENAVYRIVLKPESPSTPAGEFVGLLRGHVRLDTPGISLIAGIWQRVLAVIVRESGF